MATFGSFVHFVGLTMRRQKDRPKWKEPPSQRPTKVLTPCYQAQLEVSTKTAHVCKLTQLENSTQFCLLLKSTSRSNQALKPNQELAPCFSDLSTTTNHDLNSTRGWANT